MHSKILPYDALCFFRKANEQRIEQSFVECPTDPAEVSRVSSRENSVMFFWNINNSIVTPQVPSMHIILNEDGTWIPDVEVHDPTNPSLREVEPKPAPLVVNITEPKET